MMALDTRSTDRLGELEKRMDAQTTTAAGDRARLEQSIMDISDLKFSMSRMENSLKDLVTGIASLAAQGQGDPNGGSSSSPHQNPHIQFGLYCTNSVYFPPTKQARV